MFNSEYYWDQTKRISLTNNQSRELLESQIMKHTLQCSETGTTARRKDLDFLMTSHSSMEDCQSYSSAGCSACSSGADITYTISTQSLRINKKEQRKPLEKLFHSYRPWRMSATSVWSSATIWYWRLYAMLRILNILSSGASVITPTTPSTSMLREVPSEVATTDDLAAADIGTGNQRGDPRTKWDS